MNSKHTDTIITDFCTVIDKAEKATDSQYNSFKQKTDLILCSMLYKKYGPFFTESEIEIIIDETIIQLIKDIFDGSFEIRSEGEAVNYIKKITSGIASKIYMKRFKINKIDLTNLKLNELMNWGVNCNSIVGVNNVELKLNKAYCECKFDDKLIEYEHMKTYNKNASDKDIFWISFNECINKLPTNKYNLRLIAIKRMNDIPQNKIAESMNISESTMTRLINKRVIPSLTNCLITKGWDEVTFYEMWR